MLLLRLTEGGDPDLTFGGDGEVTTDIGVDDFANDVVVSEAGGEITVGGIATKTEDDWDMAALRYEADGDLDPTFSGDGKQTTDFFDESLDRAFAVAVQPDGKTILAGGSGSGPDQSFALARYMPNGTLDDTFDADGLGGVFFPPFALASVARDVAILPNQQILVAGLVYEGTSFGRATDFALARLEPNGVGDFDFAGDGRMTTDFGGLISATRSPCFRAVRR